VESTINQVVSRRLVKKQQMQWTLRGAHLLLQARTKVLNAQRRTGRGVPAAAPEIPPATANDSARPEGGLTPGLLLHSIEVGEIERIGHGDHTDDHGTHVAENSS